MKLTERKTAKGKTLYYLQTTVEIDGKKSQKKIPMGDNSKKATTRANRFLATLGETGYFAAMEELNGGNPIKKGDSPTLEQIEKLYRDYLKASAKLLKEKTVYDNLKALGRVMKACGAETISEINHRTLRTLMLPKNPTEANLRGFSATIQHAASIFKPACLDFYDYHNIKVQNPFSKLELTAPQIKPYTPLPSEVLTKIRNDAHTLPACEQIILSLSLEYGLRRMEVEHCQTSWFSDNGGRVFLSVKETTEFKPKVGAGRVLPVARNVYEKIMELREPLNPQNDFVAYVDSTTNTARLDRRFKSLTKYLRGCGVTGKRPIQSMRAECGSRVVTETKSIFEAQRVLGHSDPGVTARHYANLLETSTVGETKQENPLAAAAKLLGVTLETLEALQK